MPCRNLLRKVFDKYSHSTSHSQGLSFDQIAQENESLSYPEFLRFGIDFGIVPRVYSKEAWRAVFARANLGISDEVSHALCHTQGRRDTVRIRALLSSYLDPCPVAGTACCFFRGLTHRSLASHGAAN